MIFDRTFHPDEANQAFTTGKLLETGNYVYQPEDHHGPTLYYAAAALQKAYGHGSTATLDGTLLRCTPLLFAVIALVFGFLALRRIFSFKLPADPDTLKAPKNSKVLNTLASICFVFLLGTSPIFVFFATDFIQEMLLACFTMMMFWAGTGYLLPGDKWKPGTWALLFGIAAGLAFATKETSVLAFAAIFATFLILKALKGINAPKVLACRDAVMVIMGFLLTATLFYSSFCANWTGVYNAFIAAPLAYIHRATGSAASTGAAWHIHPWWQYLKWLFFCDWCFSALPLLAIFLATFNRRSFLHVYILALLAIYSLIPYKTPWCGLQLIVPMAIASFATNRFSQRWKILLPIALIALAVNSWGLYHLNSNPDSKSIPYNYASASPEVKQLAATVATALSPTHSPANSQLTTPNSPTPTSPTPFLAVALPPADTWPFPWYNRKLENRTGYWTDFEALRNLAESGAKPAVVIVPMEEGHLVQPIFPHLKNTKRFYMRPGVRVRVFW